MRYGEITEGAKINFRVVYRVQNADAALVIAAPDERTARRLARQQLDRMYLGQPVKLLYVQPVE